MTAHPLGRPIGMDVRTPPPARIAIRVHGVPIPQGSKTAGVVKGRAIIRDANSKTLKPWRAHLTEAITDQTRYLPALDGPVRVWLRFTFDRPPSHYGVGRGRHTLRSTAPAFPGHSCGDTDKLARAVLDSLTDARTWLDDTQVVDLRARKFYAGDDELALDHAGVDIILEPLGGDA